MNRRELLRKSAILAGAGLGLRPIWPVGPIEEKARQESEPSQVEGKVMTVTGPIAPEEVGLMLPHEHVISRFGAPPARRPDYDVAALFEAVVPYLKRVKQLGCRTIADCTAAYFGRDPLILKQLAERSGVHLLANTGYYGAAGDRYVPEHAYRETADELAARWLREWTEGVDRTGIRPGFIKTAVDSQPLSEIDRKLIRAAARTHLKSGLTIAVHTQGRVKAAREQLALLRAEGVRPEAWIWVHAQAVKDPADLAEAARQGAWVEFDDLGPDAVERHLELVQEMKRRGLLDRVLLSHDGSSFPPDGEMRPYDTLFTTFIPRLKAAGFSTEEVRRLTVENPRRAFTVRVRAR